MPQPIADYALIGNLHTAALVAKNGSIDWFCPLRFDAPACFAALLGNDNHGHWRLAPVQPVDQVERRYHQGTLILETQLHTPTGAVAIIDYMPVGEECHILRRVKGLSGNVDMISTCKPAFDYGHHPAVPKVHGRTALFQSWDQALRLSAPIPLSIRDGGADASFTIAKGETLDFTLSCRLQPAPFPTLPDPDIALAAGGYWWRDWSQRCCYRGPWRDQVLRSLISLKAAIYTPTGAMVAAPTTSLPEIVGGEANWDYRFCWPRDASLTLDVLLDCGFQQEAQRWRDWLLRSACRDPQQEVRTLYTLEGLIRHDENPVGWLPGYRNSQPVRVGNAASRQRQLDIRGELFNTLSQARLRGLEVNEHMWAFQRGIIERIEQEWREPDPGIWETRDDPRQFTQSKAMCWVVFDRAIRDARQFNLPGDLPRWENLRDTIRDDILRHGIHSRHGYFTRDYESDDVDASLLLLPIMGFVAADDPQMSATVAAIERELCTDGLVYRNRFEREEGQGTFVACTFWLVDYYCLAGRENEAHTLFRRALELCNDVGLLAEQYDPRSGEFRGNFPQSLSHLALIRSAHLLDNLKTRGEVA